MHRLTRLVAVALGIWLTVDPAAHADGGIQIGVGAHYWRALDDIEVTGVDEDGVAWYASLQIAPMPVLRFEFDLEVLPEEYAGATDTVLAPAAYLVVGSGIYAAVGVGAYHSDGDFADDPFYALRAGLNFEPLPSLVLDINANYRVNEWNGIRNVGENISSDTITLGAAARLRF